MDRKKTISFWQWFAENANNFEDEKYKNSFLTELDKWVYKLGNYAWEVGPGYNSTHMFVLSPHGDKKLLMETKNIIYEAPKLEKWEFYYSKQPLQAKLKFILYQGNTEFEFDASEWKYVLLKFPDNTFDILIKAENVSELSFDDQVLAAKLAIDGVIGEEKRMELFGEIEVLEIFPSEYEKAISDFPNLLNHFKQFFKREFNRDDE